MQEARLVRQALLDPWVLSIAGLGQLVAIWHRGAGVWDRAGRGLDLSLLL